jgi:hypothetical protein
LCYNPDKNDSVFKNKISSERDLGVFIDKRPTYLDIEISPEDKNPQYIGTNLGLIPSDNPTEDANKRRLMLPAKSPDALETSISVLGHCNLRPNPDLIQYNTIEAKLDQLAGDDRSTI